MKPMDEAYKLTMSLLADVNQDADPCIVAMAHLGTAVALLGECDPELAENLRETMQKQDIFRSVRPAKNRH